MVNVPKWKKWTIGELISRTKTTIQTGPFGTVLSASEFVNYGIPVISVREIREGFIRVTDETPCVTDETFSRLGKYALSANDIVFARKGSVDRSAVIPDGAERYFLGSDGIRIRFDESVVNPNLMLYIFQSPSTKQFLIQSSYGTTMAGLNEKILSELEFYLPETIEEQSGIAQVLTDIDKQLTLTEEMIAKKRAIKQGTMQELLTGKKRLPGFSNKWEIKTLRELSIEMVDGPFGSDLKTEHYTTDRQVRIIQLSNIGESGWNDTNTKYTTFAHAAELSRCVVQPGSVLIAKMMPAGRAIICPDSEKGYILGSDVVKVIPNNSVDSRYLLYATKSQFYLDQIADDTQGSTRARTSVSKLRKTAILFPSKEEQIAIATVLYNMDSEIEALEQKLAKYRQVKQGMMQQLLTGKIRLV